MKKQKGWINIDPVPVMVGFVCVGVCIGLVLSFVIPWLWDIVKPTLHSLTA